MNHIRRIVRTAKDFETVGLAILSYYLQLYAIELILEDKSKSEDLRQLASELLDRVEKFKSEVQSMDDTVEEKRVLGTLLEDQDKAMAYCTNFAMTMYNNNLSSMNSGNVENVADMKKALWCCIDLFSCIIKLWGDSLSDQQNLQKRVKYCKLCLRKLATAELKTSEAQLSLMEESKSMDVEERDTSGGNINSEEKLEESEEKEETDHEVSEMLTKLEKIVSDDARQEETDTDMGLDAHEPTFIESEEENSDQKPEGEANASLNKDYGKYQGTTKLPDTPTSGASGTAVAHERHTTADLENMMDRAEKIEKVQKMAKYAISALNYEDIGTAKRELRDALNLLETLRE